MLWTNIHFYNNSLILQIFGDGSLINCLITENEKKNISKPSLDKIQNKAKYPAYFFEFGIWLHLLCTMDGTEPSLCICIQSSKQIRVKMKEAHFHFR